MNRHLFADMPIFFDYDKYEIKPWGQGPLIQIPAGRLADGTRYAHSRTTAEYSDPVCIDLTELRPVFTVPENGNLGNECALPSRYDYKKPVNAGKIPPKRKKSFPEPFLWQQWKNERSGEFVDIELFTADALYLHPDATTISMPDLFFRTRMLDEALARQAAWGFASRLRKAFTNDTLFWLTPDYLHDIEMEIIRRSINACFPKAEPLPRSVAAVFERVDYKFVRDGYSVVVIDTIGGVQCATKLEAYFDPKLKEYLPETRGFRWERQPPVVFTRGENGGNDWEDPEGKRQTSYDIPTVDERGRWHEAVKPKMVIPLSEDTLCRDKRIGRFDAILDLDISKSPVQGGIRLYSMQKRLAEKLRGNDMMPQLWCAQIPALFISAKSRGKLQHFCLVAHGSKKVDPVRGQSVRIPVRDVLKLPQGTDSLKLFVGENEEDLGYSAKLVSPDVPLREDLICGLELSFTYGANDPYDLTLIPMHSSIAPIHVRWEKSEEEIISDARAPEYPKALSLDELRNYPNRDGIGTTDLLNGLHESVKHLDKLLFFIPRERTKGVIKQDWDIDINKRCFTRAKVPGLSRMVFIHENCFIRGRNAKSFKKECSISFELKDEGNGKYKGLRIAEEDYTEEKHLRTFDKIQLDKIKSLIYRLHFYAIQIWRDGRSVQTKSFSREDNLLFKKEIEYLTGLLHLESIPEEIKNVLLSLFSCIHRDAPDECVEWINEQINSGFIKKPRPIGFCLGDISQPWQKDIFQKLISKTGKRFNASQNWRYPGRPSQEDQLISGDIELREDVVRVLSYAIWREEHFIDKLTLVDLSRILSVLLKMLKRIKPCPKPQEEENSKIIIGAWNRKTVEPLDLLLGLLRTRDSSDEEIRMLLQPHQKITKTLAKQIENLTDMFVESGDTISSHIRLGNLPPKEKGDKTPDLLYALRLYLTGDDGANAIEIIGISDEDND